MFGEVEALVRTPKPSLRHLVLARIWWIGYGVAGRAAQAARQLLMVDKRHHGPNYARYLVMMLAATEPARVLQLKRALLACSRVRDVARSSRKRSPSPAVGRV